MHNEEFRDLYFFVVINVMERLRWTEHANDTSKQDMHTEYREALGNIEEES
jgi:hypothetical protein